MDNTTYLQMILTFLSGLIGAGGGLAFIKFLIERRDNQKKEEKQDKLDKLATELRAEYKQGLDDRENTGKARYLEHQKSIKEMSESHQKDFEMLIKAIDKLESNDKKQLEIIEQLQKNENLSGQSLMALSHDKIIHLGKCYQKRGAITLTEQNNLKFLYEPYRNLGGNSDGEGYYNFCMHLPIITEEEAIELDSNKVKKESSEKK